MLAAWRQWPHGRPSAAHPARRPAAYVAPFALQELVYETDPRSGLQRVRYNREGWRYWDWRGYRVHYIQAGAANTGLPVVLVHGYGASAVHW